VPSRGFEPPTNTLGILREGENLPNPNRLGHFQRLQWPNRHIAADGLSAVSMLHECSRVSTLPLCTGGHPVIHGIPPCRISFSQTHPRALWNADKPAARVTSRPFFFWAETSYWKKWSCFFDHLFQHTPMIRCPGRCHGLSDEPEYYWWAG